jgi:gamma-glutamyl hercynylcysteine S-oxide synthase
MITKTSTTTHLAQMLTHARAGTDILFGLVRPEAFYERPIPERHRIIFYFGHLEAFDWNLLSQAAGVPSISPEFDQLFAFGIDPKPGQTQQDERSDWPEIAEVQQYNRRVRQTLDDISNQISEQMLSIAMEHRLMHAETFAYLLHALSIDQKHIPLVAPLPQSALPIHVMLEIPGGTVTLGQPRKDLYGHHPFGWDNEFESLEVSVRAFAL